VALLTSVPYVVGACLFWLGRCWERSPSTMFRPPSRSRASRERAARARTWPLPGHRATASLEIHGILCLKRGGGRGGREVSSKLTSCRKQSSLLSMRA
jgi:hypothetical protein